MDHSKIDVDNERFEQRTNRDALRTKGSRKDIALASLSARFTMKECGLIPEKDELGEWEYTIEQGAKAACFAREDALVILMVQETQLDLLYINRALLFICLCLLTYIAYRV